MAQKSVNSAGVVAGRFLFRVGFNLHFVAPAKIDAAVGFFSAIEFNVQFEIFKLRVVDQFGPWPGLTRFPSSTFHSLAGFGLSGFHPVRSLPLNNLMGLPHLGVPVRLSEGALRPVHVHGVPSGPVVLPDSVCPFQRAFKDHVIFAIFFRFRRNKSQMTLRDCDFRQRPCISPAAHELRFELSVFLLDLDP